MKFINHAPVSLFAMTLRGIGSYIGGQRLEIKPLTILCGENGAGKSTWLKALRILRQSLDRNLLPFGFAIEDWQPNDVQLTNSFYHLAPSSIIEEVANAEDEARFGVPGTIGLEFIALVGNERDAEAKQPSTPGLGVGFIFDGSYPTGTVFRIRVAHPSYQHDHVAIDALKHVIELTINDQHVIRFESERDPHQRFHAGSSYPRRQKPYRVLCSRSFIDGNDQQLDLIEIGRLVEFPHPRFDFKTDTGFEVDPAFASVAIERIQHLLRLVMDNVFDIGAIRLPHNESGPSSSLSTAQLQHHPHVGTQGEHAWQVECVFSNKRMRDPNSVLALQFLATELDAPTVQRVFAGSGCSRKIDRIVECLPMEYRSPINKLRALNEGPVPPFNLDDDDGVHGQPVSTEPLNSEQPFEFDFNSEFFANALNSLIGSTELYDPAVWSDSVYFYSADQRNRPEPQEPDIKAAFNDWYLFELTQYNFNSDTILYRIRNYLLIVDAFFEQGCSAAISRDQLPFDQYLSYWLNHLLGISLSYATNASRRTGIDFPLSPSYYAADVREFRPIAPLICESGDWDAENTAIRIHHPCFGKGEQGYVQPPRQLSAAFHQIYPILVQLGVMTPGQVVGIENPEVHLHPALQTKIAAMLVAHADHNRTIIVETHSDLVVRRVMRAILEETIPQQKVMIYMVTLKEFVEVELEESRTTFYASLLEPIRIDGQGRVANWPAGFLDEDVFEARRLLSIMYGRFDTESEGDDE